MSKKSEKKTTLKVFSSSDVASDNTNNCSEANKKHQVADNADNNNNNGEMTRLEKPRYSLQIPSASPSDHGGNRVGEEVLSVAKHHLLTEERAKANWQKLGSAALLAGKLCLFELS